MQFRFVQITSGIIFTLLIFTLIPQSVAAATISISPLRQEIGLNPGQAVDKTLLVLNKTNKKETVAIFAQSFGVVNKNYDYSFGKPPDYSSWIQFDTTKAIIGPNKSHEFKYSIAVPNEAEPGGHYIVLFASVSKNPKSDPSTTLVEQVGSLIYLTVKGKVSQLGKIVGYNVSHISFAKKIDWNLLIGNSGNNHFISKISQSRQFWLTGSNYQPVAEHLILPKTIRSINGQYDLGNWPGIYKVSNQVGLGDNQVANPSAIVVYLPPIQSLLLLAALIVLFVWLYRIYKSRQNRKLDSE